MVQVTHSNVNESKGYVCLFGNLSTGRIKAENQTVQKFWKQAVKDSGSKSFGDVTLFYNGKLIRSVWNFCNKLNATKHPATYNKY